MQVATLQSFWQMQRQAYSSFRPGTCMFLQRPAVLLLSKAKCCLQEPAASCRWMSLTRSAVCGR